MRPIFFTVLAVFLACVLGCSNKVQVTGTVTFEDGTPLTAGTVVFDNGRDQARGVISEDGTYRLSSIGHHDGIAPGEYGVYITGAFGFSGSAVATATTVPRPDDLIDTRFTSVETSGLSVVVEGRTVFDIIVTPPAK